MPQPLTFPLREDVECQVHLIMNMPMLHAMNQRQGEKQIAEEEERQWSEVEAKCFIFFFFFFKKNVYFIGLLSGTGANAQFVCLAQ